MKTTFGILVTLSACVAVSVFSQCITPNDLARNDDPNDLTRLTSGERNLSISLLRHLAASNQEESVFLGPISIHSALLLTLVGANGTSASQIGTLLNVDHSRKLEFLQAQRTIQNLMHRRSSETRSLKLADRLYFDQKEPLRTCLTMDLFPGDIEKLDFQGRPDECRTTINNWIKEKTADNIKELLAPGTVDSSTRMALVNAAYFKDDWANKFDPARTRPEIFYKSSEDKHFVTMMKRTGIYRYAPSEELLANILDIPYKGEDISLILLLPPNSNNTLAAMLQRLTDETFQNALQSLQPRTVELTMPKFTLDQRADLVQVLGRMGVQDVFNPAKADFSGFSHLGGLALGAVQHQARLQIDEHGTEAAAATAVLGFRTARPVEPVPFKCDHPFAFFIYDHQSEVILFEGIYRGPKNEQNKSAV